MLLFLPYSFRSVVLLILFLPPSFATSFSLLVLAASFPCLVLPTCHPHLVVSVSFPPSRSHRFVLTALTLPVTCSRRRVLAKADIDGGSCPRRRGWQC